MIRKIWLILLLVPAMMLILAKPALAQHSTKLNWNPSSDGAANPTLGYNIFRGAAPGLESTTPINPTMTDVGCLIFSACTYTDTNVTVGNTYYYVVQSNLNGVASINSNEVKAVIPPAPATGLVVTVQ